MRNDCKLYLALDNAVQKTPLRRFISCFPAANDIKSHFQERSSLLRNLEKPQQRHSKGRKWGIWMGATVSPIYTLLHNSAILNFILHLPHTHDLHVTKSGVGHVIFTTSSLSWLVFSFAVELHLIHTLHNFFTDIRCWHLMDQLMYCNLGSVFFLILLFFYIVLK